MPCNLLSLPLILLYVGGYAQLSHLILPLHDDLEVQNLCVCRRRAAFYQVSIWLPGKQRQLRLGSGDMSSALSLPLPSCVSVARPSASLRLPFLFWKKGEHQPPLEVTETSPRSHSRELHVPARAALSNYTFLSPFSKSLRDLFFICTSYIFFAIHNILFRDRM